MDRTILIVDDEKPVRLFLESFLRGKGFSTVLARNARDARRRMSDSDPDVVLMDLKLPDANGNELIGELKQAHPRAQFIIITAFGSIRSAVDSTRMGAADYLTKPIEPDELMLTLRNVTGAQALEDRYERLVEQGSLSVESNSPAMTEPLEMARMASEQDGIVLLLGESGTGKDHLARWIHDRSRRGSGPYFAINCAALTRELAESELFGHEPGAFTGTQGRKRGLLELAEGGTLLLNEIGEMDLAMQAKLLTFLDTKSFIRVGGERMVKVDARIFAATNRNLESEIEKGSFRRDLYYRLNVLPVHLPPLRTRPEDIPMLAESLLQTLCKDMGMQSGPELMPDALDALVSHPWPGNIRELRNVLERALIASRGAEVRASHVHLLGGEQAAPTPSAVSLPLRTNLKDAVRDLERNLVAEALRRASTKKEAASLLGISRHALAYYIKCLDVEPSS